MTLNVHLAAASVPKAIRALQDSSSLADATVGLQIYPTYAGRERSDVGRSAYVAALEDARAKAQTIATYARARLGSIRSVAEVLPTQNGGGFNGGQLEPMPPPRGSSVSAPANGVVMLAVTFDAGNLPISVLGMHAGPVQQSAEIRDATGLEVQIRGRGETLGAAQQRMSAAENSIRSIVTQYGATPNDIVVTNADANAY